MAILLAAHGELRTVEVQGRNRWTCFKICMCIYIYMYISILILSVKMINPIPVNGQSSICKASLEL